MVNVEKYKCLGSGSVFFHEQIMSLNLMKRGYSFKFQSVFFSILNLRKKVNKTEDPNLSFLLLDPDPVNMIRIRILYP